MKANVENLVRELAKCASARFVSFTYVSRGTGEKAKYTLLTNANLEKVYQRDLNVALRIKIQNALEGKVKDELVDSLRESLNVGIGNNSKYTCKDVYAQIFNGVKIHKENGEIHCAGFLVRKEVIEPGIEKKVNSKPETLIKNRFRKQLRLGKFRQFVLPDVQSAALNGKILELV